MGSLDPSEVRKGLAQDKEFEIEKLLDNLPGRDLMAEWDNPEQPGNAMQNHQKDLTSDGYCDIIKASSNDDENIRWVTINGTPVPVDENGNLNGTVGNKIAEKNKQGTTEAGGERKAKISATGANVFLQGFTSKNLDKHWVGGKSDHSANFPGYTKQQYADEALRRIQAATGDTVKGYKSNNGMIVRYDITENIFIKGHPENGIATMFKPKAGEEYFKRKMKEDGGTTDD